MNARTERAINRLKTLFDGQGEDRIFAHVPVALPAETRAEIERLAARLPAERPTPADLLFPLWERSLAGLEEVEDDWLPCIYPHQYDQGIYGALFGAKIEFTPGPPPGYGSSMTQALAETGWEQLLELAAAPDFTWLERLAEDLRRFAARSGGRFGVGVPITIDGFNLCQQIRGNQTFLDIYDDPDGMKRFLQAGVTLNIEVVERQRAAIGTTVAGGVFDFFNAGWMPGAGIPMSVDCYNLCHPEVYAEFGRPYQQQLIDYFGAGNFHVHGDGRHLLPELARLGGCVMAFISDDGAAVPAIDDLVGLKRLAGSIVPAVACPAATFVAMLRRRRLVGGVYYVVGEMESVAAANRLMEQVRGYRI